MNVDTMRNIDYYAGVPLTFLATWIRKILPLGETRRERPENVLLIELSEMGSAILVDPAMEKLKQNGAELYFAIFKKNSVSLKLLNTVKQENIFEIREDSITHLITDTLKFLVWCRKKKIDTVIDLELFSRFTALLTGFCGAYTKVGFYRYHNEGLYRGEMLTHKVAYNPHIHITKNFIALVNAVYSKEKQLPYTKSLVEEHETVLKKAQIDPTDVEAVKAAVKKSYDAYNGQEIVLINANASDLLPQRRWSQDGYIEVIKKVLEHRKDVLVLLTGAPAEREGLQNIATAVGDARCINFAGEVAFLQLPALYSISSFMLTNDSGPAHFAAVTSMPTYVIFGPETPDLYRSLGETTAIYAGMTCSPCVSAWNHRKTSCTDNQCLQVITPERVFNTIKERLG